MNGVPGGAQNKVNVGLDVHLSLARCASNLLGGGIFAGLLSRILVTAPEGTTATGIRHIRHRKEQPETDRDLRRYYARLLSMLQTQMPLASGKSSELEPARCPCPAKRSISLWNFTITLKARWQWMVRWRRLGGLGNKLAEHAARLAAVLTALNDLYAAEVAGHEMQAGIALAEYYALRRPFGSSVFLEWL
jgi:hypothetical protein